VVRKEIADFMEDHMFWGGLTQFGNPASCAAAIASIRFTRKRDWLKTRECSAEIVEGTGEDKAEAPSIGDVRGLGSCSD